MCPGGGLSPAGLECSVLGGISDCHPAGLRVNDFQTF